MSTRLDSLADYIHDIMPTWQVPSVAVAVVRENTLLHHATYGLRDVEQGTPADPDTRYAAASMTKAFTAMGVALLVEEGLAEWDTPVRDYLPSFRLKDAYASQNITFRDMLSHRSGLPRHDMAWYGSTFSRDELMELVQHHEPNKTFRASWEYNNMMYMAAGAITGHLAGMSWEQFIQTRIFDPLGMTSASFDPDDPRSTPNTATPYQIDHKAGQPDTLRRMPYYRGSWGLAPAGHIFVSLNDMLKWLTVHINGGRSGEVQLVSENTLKEMHRPVMIVPTDGMMEALLGTTLRAYGMGWFVEPYRGYTLVHHGGNIDGFSVLISFIPQAKVGAVVLTNIEGRPVRDLLTYEIYDRLLDLPDHDWNAKYHAIIDSVLQGMDQQRETADAERIPDTQPSHPLSDYVGVFAADGYQDIEVRMAEEGLEAKFAGHWGPLAHYHYDIFELSLDEMQLHLKLTYMTDVRGAIGALSGAVEPAIPDVTFKRKPVVFTAEALAAVVGVYDAPLEGLALTLMLKADGKLYAQLTGQPQAELIPYQRHGEALEFMHGKAANVMVEVTPQEAIIKQPGMTLKCPRRV